MTNLVRNHEETVMKIYNFFNKRKYVYIYTVPCSYILWTKAHVLIDCASRSRLHTDKQFLKTAIASSFSMNSNVCYWVTCNDMHHCSSRKFLIFLQDGSYPTHKPYRCMPVYTIYNLKNFTRTWVPLILNNSIQLSRVG